MPPGLAQRLRDETRALHLAAERSPAMNALLRGRMERPAYARMLRDLHAIYEALERGIARHATRPAVAVAADGALPRAARLAQDLDVVGGPTWRAALAPSAAARAYAERLVRVSEADPDLLLAHAWVRYMGDLAGGRYVARAVQRALALEPARGAAFYDFPEIADPDGFRASVNAAIDALSLPERDAARIVDEARWAFAAHVALFAEPGQDALVVDLEAGGSEGMTPGGATAGGAEE